MPLTNTTVHNAKPREKPYKLADGGGLYLLVSNTGSRYWRYDYRVHGKRKTLAIGVYDQTSLKEAREKHRDAKKLIEQGIDPVIEKKRLQQEELIKKREGKSFREAALAWVEFKSLPNTKRNWKPNHAKKIIKSLELNIFPRIGDMVLNTITIDDVEDVLKPITERGALDVASRSLGRMESTFRYAKIKRWCDNNPADGLKEIQPRRKTKHMAFLTYEDLPKFLYDLDNYTGDFICKSAIKFVLLTHVRTNELRYAAWDEIDFEKGLWSIPAERMKMKVAQIIPLSSQALELLNTLKAITGSSKYIFASLIKMTQPISENGMLSVIYNMGYKGITTIHGLRATYSTIANEQLRFRSDVIEAALAHKVADPVRGAYNHATYLDERIENIQQWADYLDGLRYEYTR